MMTGHIWILPSWIYNQLLATIWMLHPTPIPHRYTLFLLHPPRRHTIYEELYPLLIHTLLATPSSQSPPPCQTSFLLHPPYYILTARPSYTFFFVTPCCWLMSNEWVRKVQVRNLALREDSLKLIILPYIAWRAKPINQKKEISFFQREEYCTVCNIVGSLIV